MSPQLWVVKEMRGIFSSSYQLVHNIKLSLGPLVSAWPRWPIIRMRTVDRIAGLHKSFKLRTHCHWISWSVSSFAQISNLNVDMLSVNIVTWVRGRQDVQSWWHSWWVWLPPDQWGVLLCPGPLLLPHPDRRVPLPQPLSSVQREGARGETFMIKYQLLSGCKWSQCIRWQEQVCASIL